MFIVTILKDFVGTFSFKVVGHVTKLVPIRLGEPKEGQQHYNSAIDLPSN